MMKTIQLILGIFCTISFVLCNVGLIVTRDKTYVFSVVVFAGSAALNLWFYFCFYN